MNKNKMVMRNIFISLVIIIIPFVAKAQGQDPNTHEWNGNPISSVLNASEEDMNQVYLYNVGTKRFLNTGSCWGTSVSAYNVGMPIIIESQSGYKPYPLNSDSYQNYNYMMKGAQQTVEGTYISFGRWSDTNDHDQGPNGEITYNRVYCDRNLPNNGNANGIPYWKFTETYNGSRMYKIHCYNNESNHGMPGEFYLKVLSETTNSEYLDFNYSSDCHAVNNDDYNGLWKIVTLKDLKKAFKEQYASDESPADATFLIADQNFSRSNTSVNKWVVNGFSQKFIQNTYSFDNTRPYTYYVGMGCKESDAYQKAFGRYWIASVRNLWNNDKANGTLTQEVEVIQKGWYKVSCDGFYRKGGSSNIVSKLFAKVKNNTEPISNVSAVLNQFRNDISYQLYDLYKEYKKDDVNTESPYVKAAKLFEQGKYRNSIMVYVPNDNDVLQIGIEISGSTNEYDWTAFDNFQLQYCGNRDLVLDENQTSLDYMTMQVDEGKAKTLILKRTMKTGVWNSFTLPVSLTAAQFKTAFGDQVILSKFRGQNEQYPSRIDFESIDLSNNNEVVIEPEKLYIMKSTREANVTTGSYMKKLTDNNNITVNAPYYVINNVTLNDTPQAIFREESKPSSTSDVKLQFCGAQINHTEKIVPKYSYVLGASDGQWYFTQNDLSIKGFRCWIATGDNATTPSSHLSFFIDGVEEGSITDIENIEFDRYENVRDTNGIVYNINGQVVRTGPNLNNLPKGIYIINNKKYIIK